MALISNGTTVASGGSVTVSSSAVASGNAGIAGNAVGSYMFAKENSWTNRNYGGTLAGSGLSPTNGEGNAPGTTLSGTWRIMGYTTGNQGPGYNSTLYLRIS